MNTRLAPALAPRAHDWLVGGGEMGEHIRSLDWAATPLGPIETWPQSLRSAVSILLPSRAQICLFWGPDLVTIYNDAYLPVLGIKHPWALGKPARETWSEIWQQQLRALFEGVLETGEAFWASDLPFFLGRHGYIEETFFDVSYDPVRDESGRVGGIFCIVSDQTGRVLSERRLRIVRDFGRAATEAKRFDEFIRHAGEVLGQCPQDLPFALFYAWDPAHRVARRLFATGIDESIPAARELVAATDRDSWPLGEALSSSFVVLDGERLAGLGALPGGPWPDRAAEVAVLAVGMPGQQPYGFLVVGINARRRLDDAYRDFLRLLAASMAGAIASVRALEQERDRAEALAAVDRAKTAFFSNVSHEFRTPLTLLLGPLEEELAGAGGKLAPESRERLGTALRNARRLQKLVNSLLDFSRIEAGRAQASYEPTDLALVTEHLASNFVSACERAGLELVIECQPLPQPVFVDPDMWEKIVLNLLSNAFKFTFEGAIAVRLAPVEGGAELSVRDTGIGIAADEIPRLFERFHRVEGARSRTYEGSGIGLALVQELVRLHGGEIRVNSQPGAGSTFTVKLRYGSGHLPAGHVAPSARHATDPHQAAMYAEEALGWLRGIETGESVSVTTTAAADAPRILVVDDNADMREYLARILGQHWRVDTAIDGEHALAALDRGGYDLVISDVMMPRVDGFQLLQVIRSRPAAAHLPVILLSARAGEEAVIEGLEAGADDYLVKPFAARELIAQVRSNLALSRARVEAQRERELLLARERDAKREAEVQRAHLMSLFAQAPNPVVMLRGPEYIVDLVNAHTCRIWGRTPEEVLGRPMFDVLPELRGQVFKGLLDEVLRTGMPYEGKEVLARLDRHGDGRFEDFYFNFVYAPVRATDGSIEGILVVAFDVTDEVRARQQVEALRTEAESANRAKDEFLAMLGHELRNPLSPIVTTLQVMRLRGVPGTELQILERQVGHLTRLVDDLLDVSRIARGRIELNRKPLEIADVIVKAMELASPILEQRGHRVDIDVARTGLCVDADPQRLTQVFVNLLTNAAKYSDLGSRIVIAARHVENRVRVSIADEGIGIAPEMIDRVFELFVQQPQSLARSGGGLGLGLAIVRNLVDLHGGTVTARSEGPGRGSEFTVDLPARAGPVETRQAAENELSALASLPRRRILVIDDNPDITSTLKNALERLGHTVETANDGPTALDLAPRFHPEVALVDIGLPAMDGYEVAAALRALGNGFSRIRLVAITGYGLEADRQRTSQAGFAGHLVKPIDLVDLQNAITRDTRA